MKKRELIISNGNYVDYSMEISNGKKLSCHIPLGGNDRYAYSSVVRYAMMNGINMNLPTDIYYCSKDESIFNHYDSVAEKDSNDRIVTFRSDNPIYTNDISVRYDDENNFVVMYAKSGRHSNLQITKNANGDVLSIVDKNSNICKDIEYKDGKVIAVREYEVTGNIKYITFALTTTEEPTEDGLTMRRVELKPSQGGLIPEIIEDYLDKDHKIVKSKIYNVDMNKKFLFPSIINPGSSTIDLIRFAVSPETNFHARYKFKLSNERNYTLLEYKYNEDGTHISSSRSTYNCDEDGNIGELVYINPMEYSKMVTTKDNTIVESIFHGGKLYCTTTKDNTTSKTTTVYTLTNRIMETIDSKEKDISIYRTNSKHYGINTTINIKPTKAFYIDTVDSSKFTTDESILEKVIDNAAKIEYKDDTLYIMNSNGVVIMAVLFDGNLDSNVIENVYPDRI